MSNVRHPMPTTLFRREMPAHNWPLPKCGCRRRKTEPLNSGGGLQSCSAREILLSICSDKSKEGKGEREPGEDGGKEGEEKGGACKQGSRLHFCSGAQSCDQPPGSVSAQL